MENKGLNMSVAVVVIPTYNEAENMAKLIPLLFGEIFPKIRNWKIKILVVDGGSPDGTDMVVRDLAKKYEGLFLINEGSKKGIGAAYMKGFDYAIREISADVIIEFDADFQHPPETIATLLEKIDEGYDYVIGSRVMNGGSEPAGRGFVRTLLTEGGGWVARLVLFFPGKYFRAVTDPTSGLRATRVKCCLEKFILEPGRLYSKKFGYKLQLLSETLKTGARYGEIPLKFGSRMAGSSKIEFSTMFEILISCFKTRLLGPKLLKS